VGGAYPEECDFSIDFLPESGRHGLIENGLSPFVAGRFMLLRQDQGGSWNANIMAKMSGLLIGQYSMFIRSLRLLICVHS